MATLTAGSLYEGGATCEASDGTVYGVFVNSSGDLVVYDDIMGSPSLGDSDTPTVVHGGGAIYMVCAVIDSADLIHIVSLVATDQTRDIAYATYNTATSTLGTWEEAQPIAKTPNAPWVAIQVDSNGYPYIGYVDGVKHHGTTYDHMFNTDKSTGSWSSPERCSTLADEIGEVRNYGFAVGPNDDDMHVHWIRVGAFRSVTTRSRISGTWGSEVVQVGSESQGGNYPSWPIISLTNAGTIYNIWIDTTLGAGAFRISENNAATVAVDKAPLTPISFTLLKDSDYRYAIFIDESYDVYLFQNEGSWSSYGVIETGTFTRVYSGWGYFAPPTCVNYIYTDDAGAGGNVYSGQII